MGKALDNGEDINTVNVNGWSAAAFAVSTGNAEALSFLIDREIDLNIANTDGYTPLMLAARQSDKELVEILLEGNADPAVRTETGESAYSIAKDSRRAVVAAMISEAQVVRGMLNDDPELILTSIADGAYVNIRTTGGWNPLIFASASGYAEMVEELIGLGAEVNHVENEGWSPLHFASFNGHKEIVYPA